MMYIAPLWAATMPMDRKLRMASSQLCRLHIEVHGVAGACANLVEGHELRGRAVFGSELEPRAFGGDPLRQVVGIGNDNALLVAHQNDRSVDSRDAVRVLAV